MGALFVGISLGLLLALPVAWLWSRRTAANVRRLEQRARSAERLAELGTMTGGLAHEIKNPLSTIGLNIQLLQEDLADAGRQAGDDRVLTEQLDRISRRLGGLQREAGRLRDILEDFLRFAGRLRLDRRPTDLNALVAELADFFEPQAQQQGVRLRTDLRADPATAAVDAGLLKQAVLNLMLNGLQAMTEARAKSPRADGGCDELLLRTANATPPPTRGKRKPAAAPAVRVSVIDTGPGVPDDQRDRIFQPYVTSKRGGTGLGLPTTRRIVEEHGGTLSLHSEVGRGSVFEIELPTEAVDGGKPAAA
jgi:signal transduction histidine kinase